VFSLKEEMLVSLEDILFYTVTVLFM